MKLEYLDALHEQSKQIVTDGHTISVADRMAGIKLAAELCQNYPALRSALLAAKDYVEKYDCQGYTKLGDLKALNEAREALRLRLKECGIES